jgi:NAD+ synthase (glutamine-hydrolysing)
LIQHLTRWVISSGQFSDDVSQTLRAILAAEISPELVPVEEGQRPQSTEVAIGHYALQDFNLYYTLRFRFRPSKITFLAMHAWKASSTGDWPPGLPANQRHHYELADIRKWLEVFLRRFFPFSQFKRSAMPNGPKVSAGGSLSHRGDWRAPSDGMPPLGWQILSATFRIKRPVSESPKAQEAAAGWMRGTQRLCDLQAQRVQSPLPRRARRT